MSNVSAGWPVNAKPGLLIVDDNRAFTASLNRALRSDFKTRSVHSPDEARSAMLDPPDVILLDLCLDDGNSGDISSGIQLLDEFRQQVPQAAVVVITGHGDVSIAVDCMQRGAADFLEKPAEAFEIKTRLRTAYDGKRLSRRVLQLENELSIVEPRKIVGHSRAILELLRFVDTLAVDGSAMVLLEGETGSGKELVARRLHATGPHRSGPFIPVVLGSLPESLIESELFGHEKGAFTEARERRIGYLEQAHGGVLLLDEVGEIPTALQIRLLRFLEEREIRRLGSSRPVRVDAQVIAATNSDLLSLVQAGRFREDLYYRIAAHRVTIPPLRERREDIPLLCEYFLATLRAQGRIIRPFSADAVTLLASYHWPGNIRQLKNVVDSALLRATLHGHDSVLVPDLPSEINSAPAATVESNLNVAQALAETELKLIREALRRSDGRRAEAARLLGYPDRFTLRRRLARLSTDAPEAYSRILGDPTIGRK